MNIRQETTFLSGAKDGSENRSGFGLTGKRGKMGMKGLKRCWKSRRLVCRCLLFLQKKNVRVRCWIFLIWQMWAELAEWWRRQRSQITRGRVMGGCKSWCCSFWRFLLLLWGRGLVTLLLFLYVTEEAGRKYVRDMPWPLVAEHNTITNKQIHRLQGLLQSDLMMASR